MFSWWFVKAATKKQSTHSGNHNHVSNKYTSSQKNVSHYLITFDYQQSIIFKSRQKKQTLFHPFTNVVVNERTLGVHQVELVVNPRHHLRNRGAVRDHAARAHDLRQVSTRDDCRRLVVDAALETGRAPVDELDRALRLDGSNRRVHVLIVRNNFTDYIRLWRFRDVHALEFCDHFVLWKKKN